ncbi:Uncharacterised protein [Mannheimia haemolytica]|uniref:Uncharacterized protein n=1 Tax=Mannheimia haemolytica TaxID=75985 RepID=A0A378N7E2_MANHA|nr:Uncharacterised protein [Mannheimia haemolytica]
MTHSTKTLVAIASIIIILAGIKLSNEMLCHFYFRYLLPLFVHQ